MKKLQTFKQAEDYLDAHIFNKPYLRFPGQLGIDRTMSLLKLLGNPQNKLKVIHIAGTSGKGSTTYLISHLLFNLGYKTGMQVSPYLTDVRERTQINNRSISKTQFVDSLNQVIPSVEKVAKSHLGAPTYFEIVTALAFLLFRQEKVDYAVIETGVGGLYDATNVVDRSDKIAVLTRIGIDHTKLLGNTLSLIAHQKAGIIGKNNLVVSVEQNAKVMSIFNDEARKKKGCLLFLKKGVNYKNITLSIYKTVFDFSFQNYNLKQINLALLGAYQAENATSALAVLKLLSQRDKFVFEEKKILLALKTAIFPGRMEVRKIRKKTIIIDGAHNPQKMSNFTQSLKLLFPPKKIVFLLSFKKGKDYRKIIKYLLPLASYIVVTSFSSVKQDLLHIAESPEKIKDIFTKLKFYKVKTESNPEKALKIALKKTSDALVITGSFYLIKSIYSTIKKYS